ncbi:MAG: hypothetical protein KGH59_02700 [Candidatus Micrarchaeota archaeon]|nr:hypothetical protein [Candidatus Micrarchaeota archaeon]MDE1804666.1 hypothetical protein [Candidatus Micrarchaeota archaeon]MDE1846872.1 hypothetical protein [Candidatus Micrarchaeota archaeon]
MDLSTKMLDKSPTTQFRCGYCGSTVQSYNQSFGICQFCEMYNDNATKQDKELSGVLGQVNSLVSRSDFDAAAKLFESLVANHNSAEYNYAFGVFNQMYSDHEYGMRDYTTPNGYMEANSARINAGNAHFSTAKALFFKSILLSDAAYQQSKDANVLYAKFLSQIRLRKVLDSKATLSELESASATSAVTEYARMLYLCATSDKKSEQQVAKVALLGVPNAFYYAADLCAERSKLGDAKRFATALLGKVDMYAAKKLLIGIERAQAII